MENYKTVPPIHGREVVIYERFQRYDFEWNNVGMFGGW